MTDTTRFLSASTVIGDAVKNPQGESLGNLKEIMFNTATGKVAYGVLSFGGILGMGDKLFAVPWEALNIDAANHDLILNVSKDRLKDAPGFDKDNWPNFADQAFGQSLNTYYARSA